MFDFDNVYKRYIELTKAYFQTKGIEEIKEKSQYFTPLEEVEKMVEDIYISNIKTVRILDPSCGNGILLFKMLQKIFSQYYPTHIIIDIYDIDIKLLNNVNMIMNTIDFDGIELSVRYICEDFLNNNCNRKYDYIIMNPPYKKINVGMVPHDLKRFLYGQPNLYHLFIAKALNMLAEDGVLSVISPKNYLSGKYTEKLRQYIISDFSITKIHTFNDRRTIFGNNITQEICITHIKNANESNVKISYNGNQKFQIKMEEIIIVNETKIIYTPRDLKDYELMKRFQRFPIGTIGNDILMKTGKIVQFRVVGKDLNLKDEEFIKFENGIPLIVYRHINTNELNYQPLINKTKNKAITLIDDGLNRTVLIKNSNYVLIRKNIDKKYDKLIHSIKYLNDLKSENIALDNGIIYFTNSDDSLTEEEVQGLQCILMSKQFDDYYRMINSSHTINVYELENMHFPSLETIRLIGKDIRVDDLTIEIATKIIEQYL